MTVEPTAVIRAACLVLFMDVAYHCASKDPVLLQQFNLPANLNQWRKLAGTCTELRM